MSDVYTAQNGDKLQCTLHPAAPLADDGECRACVRLGYAAELRGHRVGRRWVHTIRFATDEEIASREPCCGEDRGTHAEWCTAATVPAPAGEPTVE